jgi:hypothetical protein
LKDNAIALWREWFKSGSDPFIPSECTGDLSCFFCGAEDNDRKLHELDCIFVRAKALVTDPKRQK